jgi:hypothetical protein
MVELCLRLMESHRHGEDADGLRYADGDFCYTDRCYANGRTLLQLPLCEWLVCYCGMYCVYCTYSLRV